MKHEPDQPRRDGPDDQCRHEDCGECDGQVQRRTVRANGDVRGGLRGEPLRREPCSDPADQRQQLEHETADRTDDHRDHQHREQGRVDPADLCDGGIALCGETKVGHQVFALQCGVDAEGALDGVARNDLERTKVDLVAFVGAICGNVLPDGITFRRCNNSISRLPAVMMPPATAASSFHNAKVVPPASSAIPAIPAMAPLVLLFMMVLPFGLCEICARNGGIAGEAFIGL